jgi:tetratricopeptide (TPR) repeat protein
LVPIATNPGPGRLASPSSTDLTLARHLASSHYNLAIALSEKGQSNASLEEFRQSIAIFERLTNEHSADVGLQTSLSVAYRAAAGTLLALHRQDEALKMLIDGLAIAQRLADSDWDNVQWRQELSLAQLELADALLAQRKIEEALKAYHNSVTTLENLPSDPSQVRVQLLIASALWSIAQLSPDPRIDGARAAAILERLQYDGRLAPAFKRKLDAINSALAKAEVRSTIQRKTADAQAAFQGQEYWAAVELQSQLIEHTEKLESEESGRPGAATVHALGILSWYALFARNYEDALAAAERALALDPAATWIAGNRAHALMFLERAEDARASYLAHRGTHILEISKLWEEAVPEDFAELERAGLVHGQMAEIRNLLSSMGEATSQR